MRKLIAISSVVLCFSAVAQAQERKIEISPFAGGYFSAGFQSIQFAGISTSGTAFSFKPTGEPNSGIFGIRGSYDFTRRISLEGTFGFSPAGQKFAGVWSFADIANFLTGTYSPPVRGRDTFHYHGNIVFHWRAAKGWSPFLTGGWGAVQRKSEVVSTALAPGFLLNPLPIPSTPPTTPAESNTSPSINFGGGVKKYFTDRCGIRFDFRNYTSSIAGDIVNNMEVSFGLIFKL